MVSNNNLASGQTIRKILKTAWIVKLYKLQKSKNSKLKKKIKIHINYESSYDQQEYFFKYSWLEQECIAANFLFIFVINKN